MYMSLTCRGDLILTSGIRSVWFVTTSITSPNWESLLFFFEELALSARVRG